uniref:Uncharacterized protein n=1 Tax=Avena sativa TaxID=4498 RepID=A0ACD5XDE1_AVESA
MHWCTCHWHHTGHSKPQLISLKLTKLLATPQTPSTTMGKHNILLVTIIVAICITVTPTTARDLSDKIVGGWKQIPNINAPEVQEIARWAVAEHARQANDGLQLKRVVSGMEQVVSGMNWKLRLEAVNGDGKEGMYIAEVYDQSWTHTRTLTSFGPAN